MKHELEQKWNRLQKKGIPVEMVGVLMPCPFPPTQFTGNSKCIQSQSRGNARAEFGWWTYKKVLYQENIKGRENYYYTAINLVH